MALELTEIKKRNKKDSKWLHNHLLGLLKPRLLYKSCAYCGGWCLYKCRCYMVPVHRWTEERSQHGLNVLTQDTEARLASACSHSTSEQTRTSSTESTVNRMTSLVRTCRSLLQYLHPKKVLTHSTQQDWRYFSYIAHASCYYTIINLMMMVCVCVYVCVFNTWCSCTLAALVASAVCYPGPGVSVAVIFTVAAEVTLFILHWGDSSLTWVVIQRKHKLFSPVMCMCPPRPLNCLPKTKINLTD